MLEIVYPFMLVHLWLDFLEFLDRRLGTPFIHVVDEVRREGGREGGRECVCVCIYGGRDEEGGREGGREGKGGGMRVCMHVSISTWWTR